jgi:hypothetical protein
MKFSDEQIQQFREQGYLAVPEFWDAREVAAMQAELERLKRDGRGKARLGEDIRLGP